MESNQLFTLQALESFDITPQEAKDITIPSEYESIPWSILPALGSEFESIVAAFQAAINGVSGGSGLYYVNTKGMYMFPSKDNPGQFIGGLKAANGGVGGGQALMSPIHIDPSQICMAVTMANIQLQLETIKEQGKEIKEYLRIKDESQLEGTIEYLIKTVEAIKMNWDNDEFRRSRREQIPNILKETYGYINQYQKLVQKPIKKKILYSSKSVQQEIENRLQYFRDYKIAINIFSFVSYLDVLFHETYNEEYLNHVIKEIEKYSLDYRTCYTQCYDILESYSKKAIEGTLVRGMAFAESKVGKVATKIPLIKKTQLGSTLKEGGRNLDAVDTQRIKKDMESFRQCRLLGENVFVTQIKTINMMYNHPIIMMFDNNNLYIGDDSNTIAV